MSTRAFSALATRAFASLSALSFSAFTRFASAISAFFFCSSTCAHTYGGVTIKWYPNTHTGMYAKSHIMMRHIRMRTCSSQAACATLCSFSRALFISAHARVLSPSSSSSVGGGGITGCTGGPVIRGGLAGGTAAPFPAGAINEYHVNINGHRVVLKAPETLKPRFPPAPRVETPVCPRAFFAAGGVGCAVIGATILFRPAHINSA